MLSTNIRLIVSLATLISPILPILSDFLEVSSGGFSISQLWINYVAFLAIASQLFFLILFL